MVDCDKINNFDAASELVWKLIKVHWIAWDILPWFTDMDGLTKERTSSRLLMRDKQLFEEEE
jgi:hypothetical protein